MNGCVDPVLVHELININCITHIHTSTYLKIQSTESNQINHTSTVFELVSSHAGWQTETSERLAAEHRQRGGRASHAASAAAAVRGKSGAAALRAVPAALLHGLAAERRTTESEGNSCDHHHRRHRHCRRHKASHAGQVNNARAYTYNLFNMRAFSIHSFGSLAYVLGMRICLRSARPHKQQRY